MSFPCPAARFSSYKGSTASVTHLHSSKPTEPVFGSDSHQLLEKSSSRGDSSASLDESVHGPPWPRLWSPAGPATGPGPRQAEPTPGCARPPAACTRQRPLAPAAAARLPCPLRRRGDASCWSERRQCWCHRHRQCWCHRRHASATNAASAGLTAAAAAAAAAATSPKPSPRSTARGAGRLPPRSAWGRGASSAFAQAPVGLQADGGQTEGRRDLMKDSKLPSPPNRASLWTLLGFPGRRLGPLCTQIPEEANSFSQEISKSPRETCRPSWDSLPTPTLLLPPTWS